MKILVACEESGTVRDAFRRRGHNAWSCDLKGDRQNSPYHFRCDVRAVLGNGWDLMIAHPPCNVIAVSGACYWDLPGYEYFRRQQPAALAFVAMLMNAPIPRICIENPKGLINSKIRKPDQEIDPTQFGHGYTKRTYLWLKNLPKLIPPSPFKVTTLEPLAQGTGEWTCKVKSPEERARTFLNIADAMAEQWGALGPWTADKSHV